MTAPLVPRQVLFGNPERVSPRISPDGTRLAWIAPDDGVLNVWVNQVGADLGKAEAVTDDRDRGIRSFFWAHDNRHLLYIQDVGGDEDWHLFSVDLETGETQDVTPFEGVQARVDETDKRFPDTILVGLNRDNPQLHDVYRLDLRTGELEKIVENPGLHRLHGRRRLQGAGRARPPARRRHGPHGPGRRRRRVAAAAAVGPGRLAHHVAHRLHPRRRRHADGVLGRGQRRPPGQARHRQRRDAR